MDTASGQFLRFAAMRESREGQAPPYHVLQDRHVACKPSFRKDPGGTRRRSSAKYKDDIRRIWSRRAGMRMLGCLAPRLFVRIDDLHVVMIEQIAGGVIELRHGELEIDLGLNEIQLCLSELGLRVQDKKDRLGS